MATQTKEQNPVEPDPELEPMAKMILEALFHHQPDKFLIDKETPGHLEYFTIIKAYGEILSQLKVHKTASETGGVFVPMPKP